MVKKARGRTRNEEAGEVFIPCLLMELPEGLADQGRKSAGEIYPGNLPRMEALAALATNGISEPQALAMLTSKLWGKSVDLAIGFMDNPSAELRRKTLHYANLWGARGAAIRFRESSLSLAHLRIAFRKGKGHYSYLGPDALHISKNEPTMNLELTLSSPEREWMRVGPHEFGHGIGCPHEHLRAELINRLDPAKTIAVFRRNYGWSESVTRSNVLTPVNERSILGTPVADDDSIMCYQISGECTRDGRPIPGGDDINDLDYAWAAKVYPGAETPPPPPPTAGIRITIPEAGNYILTKENPQ